MGKERNRRSAAALKRNVRSQGGSLDEEEEVRMEEREASELFIASAGGRHGSDARTQRQ